MLQLSNPFNRGGPIQSYGLAVVSVGLVCLVKWGLESLIVHESPFLLFILAILASAYYGSKEAGLFATALATVVSDYLFLSPYNSFVIADVGQGIQLGLFFLEGLILSVVVAQLQKTRYRAEQHRLEVLQQREQLQQMNHQLEERVTERTQKLSELNLTLSQRIRENKKTERALRQSQERLELALEASEDGIWDWNIDTRDVYLSPPWLKMLGYGPLDLPGHVNTWASLVHPEDNVWVMEQLNAHLADHSVPYNFHYRLWTKGGDWKWISNYGKVVEHNAQGQPSRMVGIHRDIHQQKVVEQALQYSEARYRAVVEDQTELICRFRPDGTLLFVNDAYCRYFQKSSQELIGRVFLPLIPLEDQAIVSRNLTTLSPNQAILTHEHRIILPTGEIRWQQWTNRAFFNEQGELIVLQAVGQDITDRKKVELQIVESLREKEVLLKEVHHRVKNNLQIICSLLNLQSRSLLNADAQEQLKESRNRIHSMALVHEKLYQSPNLDKINFAGYVEDLTRQLLRTYRVKSPQILIHVKIDASISLPIDIAVPCGLILQELVSNTLKYAFIPTEAEGHIWIQASLSRGNQLNLIYYDDGRGLPLPLDLENLTTLGLQLVMDLVEQLQGTVEIKNNPGAQFNIEFSV